LASRFPISTKEESFPANPLDTRVALEPFPANIDINVLLLVSALPAGSFSVCVDSATRKGEWEKAVHGVEDITLNKATSIIFTDMHGVQFITVAFLHRGAGNTLLSLSCEATGPCILPCWKGEEKKRRKKRTADGVMRGV
jgi:hypothetical protein